MKKQIVAKCGSKPCTGKKLEPINKSNFVIKEVSKNTVFCPDCDHVLIWTKEGKLKSKVVTQRYKPRLDNKDYSLNQF